MDEDAPDDGLVLVGNNRPINQTGHLYHNDATAGCTLKQYNRPAARIACSRIAIVWQTKCRPSNKPPPPRPRGLWFKAFLIRSIASRSRHETYAHIICCRRDYRDDISIDSAGWPKDAASVDWHLVPSGRRESYAKITSLYERCKSASREEDLNITARGIKQHQGTDDGCNVLRVRHQHPQSYEIEFSCLEVEMRQQMAIVDRNRLVVIAADCDVVQCE